MTKPASFFTDGAGIIAKLGNITNATSSPAAEITALSLRAFRKGATLVDKRDYSALRDHFEKASIAAPNGSSYKLKALHRNYLRYVLVEGYRHMGNTWETSYELASKYLCSASPIDPTTVRDSHAKMKKDLTHPNMPGFCRGLEYEYPIAMAGDEIPSKGSYLEPDFFSC